MKCTLPKVTLALVALMTGCSLYIDDADRQVSRLIHQAQSKSLGETHSADLGKETAKIGAKGSMYDFDPHPIDSDVPDAFLEARPDARESEIEISTTQPGVEPGDAEPREVLTLNEAFAYAMQNARSYQGAKEDLYLAALALTLERHLWTPRFSGDVVTRYTNYGQVRDFDHAMSAVSQIAVEQRLPYGGRVVAGILNEWVRDLGNHITVGERGQAILEAEIPLLRGAGRVAYETRYQAERNLIYAARNFEDFRRDFLVQIAGEYFDLLSTRSRVESAILSMERFEEDMQRSAALAATGRVLQVEADRARVEFLSAKNGAVVEQANFESALDRFKILLAIPTEKPIDLDPEVEIPLYEPDVGEEDAVATAQQYRLDLLNELDAIDDARRGVAIARNNMLPDLDFTGSVTMDTKPDEKNSFSYNDERTTWRGVLNAEIPFDRVAERNALRASVIDLRRAERRFEQAKDTVTLEVRQALRRLHAARVSMQLQEQSVEINATRKELARLQFEKGQLRSNRDVVEAENDWRNAVNLYAQALAEYRLAILEFLRDTGTLRVDDEGQWIDPRQLAGNL